MELGGQRHTPATLRPGMARYPLYRGLGRSQGRSGRVRKISPPTGIRSPYRTACSESLYRLSYQGPQCIMNVNVITFLKYTLLCLLLTYMFLISISLLAYMLIN